jgi:hypothetical protein
MMRSSGSRAIFFAAASAVAVAAISCRRTGPAGPTRSAGRATDAAAAALRAEFEPPADRLLTDRHLDLYVKVRRAAHVRSESDAARALGIDPDEFAWVRARIVEALVALDESHVREESAETYARAIASLKETRRRVRDPQTARTIEAQIAALERERAGLRGTSELPPDVAANSRKIEARRAELEAALR